MFCPRRTMLNHRVVITGMGCVHASGVGNIPFFQAVEAMHCKMQPLPKEFRSFHNYRTGHYVPLPEFSLKNHGIDIILERVMQPEDRMSLLATKMAIEDAGIALKEREGGWETSFPEGTGLLLGTGFTGLQTAFEGYLAHNKIQRTPESRHRFNRMMIPMLMSNSPAAWCAVSFSLHGPVHTLNAACASGSLAIGEAYLKIRTGQVAACLCGGVENLQEDSGAILRGFDQMGVCTRSFDGHPRPFSEDRSGFLFSEGGACILVLEEREAAIARGARIYAEIVGYGENNDAYSIAQLALDGMQIHRLVHQTCDGKSVQLINAHGTGTHDNDRIEAELITLIRQKNDPLPWVQASKSLLGHTFGASGAFEAAICAHGLHCGRWHGTPCGKPLSGVRLLTKTSKLAVERALSLSLGFGGHNTALLFERHSD
jgi:3-oxoacyl-[acyl-carrier-protein] synthase II